MQAQVLSLAAKGIMDTSFIRLDSTPVSSNTPQNNPKSFLSKNHVLVDCISGLPIYEITTTAEVADSTVALDIFAKTHGFLPVKPDLP